MKYLGIDYGTKRIGIATSSEDGAFSFPHSVLENKGDVMSGLIEIIKKENIQAIVVGLSVDTNGEENPVNEKIKKFAESLGEKSGLPVKYERETWSSVEAVRSLDGKNVFNARKTKREDVRDIDAKAAQIILARFLERNK